MCLACFQWSCSGVQGCDNAPASGLTADAATGEVRNYTALLAYLEYPEARLNAMTQLGTQVFVSYSFLEAAELSVLTDYQPHPNDGYWSFTAEQRANTRAAMAAVSAITGVTFVETTGTETMVQIFGTWGSNYGGWAHYPWVSESWGSGTAYMVIDQTGGFPPGSWAYEIVLHELGHVVGLKHPFDGAVVLADDLDTTFHTLMSYNRTDAPRAAYSELDIRALQHLYGAQGQSDGWVWHFAGGVFTLTAGPGADTIIGIGAASILSGGVDDDLIIGAQGNDTLYGGGDNDTLRGGVGSNLLAGGAGDDRIEGTSAWREGMAGDTVWGGMGDDVVLVFHGQNEVWAGPGQDSLYGGSGSDTLGGGAGDDLIVGQDGTGNALWGADGRDALITADWGDVAGGGAGDDLVQGGAGWDTLMGGTGNDVVQGGDGSDLIYLGADNDTAYGGAGNDTLLAGPGFDRLWGGSGADRFEFWRGAGWNRIEDYALSDSDRIAIGSGHWRADHGILTRQQVVDIFGRLNAAGDAVLDFGSAGTVIVIVAAGSLTDIAYGLELI